MAWMTSHRLRELSGLLSLLLTLSLAPALARSQDEPETRDMPETLPELPEDEAAAASNHSETSPPDSTRAEAERRVGFRLEAQLLAALSFPFGGREDGNALGFAITYGVGWGEIPVMIGIDFMSVGRSNSVTSRATTAEGGEASPVTRTNSDRLVDFDLWLRAQPPRWPIRPYAEGLFGAKQVRTEWAIARRDEPISSGSDSEWTRAIGWGVGVDFMGLFSAISTFSLTFGMRRLHGADIELERPIVSGGRAILRNRQVATNETILTAGLCGRYDFPAPE